MKRGMFTLAFIISILTISCSKNDAELAPEDNTPAAAAAPSYVSGWETPTSWQSSNVNGATVFSFKRPTPQLSRMQAARGAVLVWAKGYDFEGATKGDKPLGMPFTWIPADERYMLPYKWSFEGQEKNIDVGLEMHQMMVPQFTQSKDAIKMRYFVLSDEFMQTYKLDGPALRKLPYERLVEMLNVAP